MFVINKSYFMITYKIIINVLQNKYELDAEKCSRSMSFKMKKRIFLQSSCTYSPPEIRPFPKNYLSK